MSTQKKIVHYHIGRLSDRQPEVRLEAIRELEDIGDPEALQPLQDVFESDLDLDVRRAAQAAGRAVFLKSRAVK
ncbi:MAG: HEAT repeat domain-containing protein [Anaerolineae bacterium]|nr:HEAT repeat domain-containing protein [Chloroflexota bacterium]MBP6298450.1 HEAT repeat domain-containing protein [Anaerolineae bacterium]